MCSYITYMSLNLFTGTFPLASPFKISGVARVCLYLMLFRVRYFLCTHDHALFSTFPVGIPQCSPVFGILWKLMFLSSATAYISYLLP